MGVARAAVRKLEQELGITPKQVDINRFKFLTRLHYWAADVVTHGKNSPWGEHEIDYILFYHLKQGETLNIKPNPEEVDEVKWVSLEQLESQLGDDTLKDKDGMKMIWSPWFRIIVERFLAPLWWKDLKLTIRTDKFQDNKIHRFDCTPEHFGGAGKAEAWLNNIDQDQGAEEAKEG